MRFPAIEDFKKFNRGSPAKVSRKLNALILRDGMSCHWCAIETVRHKTGGEKSSLNSTTIDHIIDFMLIRFQHTNAEAY